MSNNKQTKYMFKELNDNKIKNISGKVPNIDGEYEAILIKKNGVRFPAIAKYYDGKFNVQINMEVREEEEEEKEEKEMKEEKEEETKIDWDAPEPIEAIPEHAEEITLTNQQQRWVDRLTTAERRFTMYYLREICPTFEKWLAIRIFSGYQRIRGRGRRRNQVIRPEGGRGVYKLADFTLIKGDVQSGKSDAMRVLATAHRLAGISTVIVIRDFTNDAKQMIKGITNFINNFVERVNRDLDRKFTRMKSLFCRADKMRSKPEEYIEALVGIEPKLLVIMANKTQIGGLLNIIDECNNPAFATIIDEIDNLAYNGRAEEVSAEERQDIYTALGDLKERSITTVGVTATVFDVLFQEERLKTDRTYILPRPSDYRGINHITPGRYGNHQQTDTITEWIPETARTPSGEDQFIRDPTIKDYYYELTNHLPFNIRIQDNRKHPINVLHKTSAYRKYHTQLYDWITSDVRTKRIWSAIIYNGSDTKVYCPQLIGRTAPIFAVSDVTANTGHFTAKSSSNISDIYTELVSVGATHIVTIAGFMADRGINFVNNDYSLQLTHQYYLPSETAKIPDLIQSMRMCGKHTVTASIPMCLYTKKSVWEEIRKGYWLQEDIIDSAMMTPGLLYPTWMELLRMEEEKLPKRKLGQRKSDKIKVAKKGKGIGMKVKDFIKKITSPPIKSSKNDPTGGDAEQESYHEEEGVEESKGELEQKEEEGVEESKIEENWGVNNLRKNLIKALRNKKQTQMIKIIKYFNSQNETEISLSELRQQCGIKQINNFLYYNKNTVSYELLIPVESPMYYKLSPKVMSVIKDILPQIYDM